MLIDKTTQNSFYLELGQLSSHCVNHLIPTFDDLPSSPYADGAFRLRRYSCFSITNNALSRLATKPFVQDENINHFQGNIVRRYPEIQDKTTQDSGFVELVNHFKSMANVADNLPIEVHQMRIFANHQEVEVAPEGVHQDGFDRIGIYIIQRHNIKGGDITIYEDAEQPAMINRPFDKGEFIVLNDRQFFHSAHPIQPIDDDSGYMDAFVLTANLAQP